jgi:hypothetical protein
MAHTDEQKSQIITSKLLHDLLYGTKEVWHGVELQENRSKIASPFVTTLFGFILALLIAAGY